MTIPKTSDALSSDHIEQPQATQLDLIRHGGFRAAAALLGILAHEVAKTPFHAWRRWEIRSQAGQAVGYIGFVGHQNLGDEALFEAIREGLSLNEPLIPFIAAEGESFLAWLGLSGTALFKAVLLGGGTLIHSFYLPAARKARTLGIPLYTVGTGAGSPGFLTPEHMPLHGWEQVLKDCPLLSVRGPLSCESLRKLGLNQAEVIGDPALHLAAGDLPKFRSRQRLVINLAEERPPTFGSADYATYSQLAKIANDFADKGGELMGVAIGPGDEAALNRFQREHGVSRLRIQSCRTSRGEFFDVVSGSVGLIGVRLHSAVLAACVGVCPILFAYREKCRDFMMSMDLADFAIDIRNADAPARLAQGFEQLQSDSALGPKVYEKAIFWKNVQRTFYARLAKQLAQTP